MPSAGRFVSRDKDKFISIKNMKSINLYSYCMSNPVRYTDPSGNDLEDQYPLTANKNDAVQINVSGNDITIDVYVDFTGDVDLITENGTSCRDMAVAGIENWSGNYLDVFGEDVTVSVNVHEGNAFFWNSQKYVTVDLAVEDGIPRTSHRGEWSNNSDRTIHMHRVDSRNGITFSDEKYVRTISHEMGHVFGIGDGYADPEADPNADLGIYRPDAHSLGLIDRDDVMRRQFSRLNISNTDIGMLILAYWENAHQSFSDYTGHKQSQYFKQGGKTMRKKKHMRFLFVIAVVIIGGIVIKFASKSIEDIEIIEDMESIENTENVEKTNEEYILVLLNNKEDFDFVAEMMMQWPERSSIKFGMEILSDDQEIANEIANNAEFYQHLEDLYNLNEISLIYSEGDCIAFNFSDPPENYHGGWYYWEDTQKGGLMKTAVIDEHWTLEMLPNV